MRAKRDTQGRLELQPSNLKITNEYFAKYEAVSGRLDQTPALVERAHADLAVALEGKARGRGGRGKRRCRYTSDTVLRMIVAQALEGETLRGIVVRIDDSAHLRRFTRIYDGPMMDYTTFCRLRNAIRPETWKELNRILAQAAVERDMISGEKLRVDTTAVETDIHWPTDSSLLLDGYRTCARLIESAREVDPDAVGNGRLHLKVAKSLALRIARKSHHRGKKAADLKPLYKRLIGHVERLLDWGGDVRSGLQEGLDSGSYGVLEHHFAQGIVEDLKHYEKLVRRVIWQARERVLHGRTVPNEKKLFSIFEPHTELLKRGKAGKDIEFGHMVQIQQVEGNFITDYDVFERKPSEPTLLEPVLESHHVLFGSAPECMAADKGYWEGDAIRALDQKVELIAIPKKGGRSKIRQEVEHDPLFRHGQAFRAGIEGTISFLKRVFRLVRCFTKGWEHYQSTIGAAIFAHNLLVLSRC